MDITKDKNILKFSCEGKTYTFNLTTGEWIGVRGSTLKYIPAVVTEEIRAVSDSRIADLSNDHRNVLLCIRLAICRYGRAKGAEYLCDSLPMLSLCERLDALNIAVAVDESGFRGYWEHSYWRFIHDNFSAYRDYRNTHPDTTNPSLFVTHFGKIKWLNENKIPVEHLAEDVVSWMYRKGSGLCGEKLRWFLYHAKTLYEFTKFSGNGEVLAERWFEKYWEEITALEIKPEKGNFMKMAAENHRTYLVRQQEIEAKRLQDYQLTKQTALNFSLNGMSVIIPTSSAQFADEARQQDNCVEWMYLPKVRDRKTHVVFIRHDDNPTKSYITCEVTNNGYINQFYLRGNDSVTKEEDIEFKRLYQEHLLANWNEE